MERIDEKPRFSFLFCRVLFVFPFVSSSFSPFSSHLSTRKVSFNVFLLNAFLVLCLIPHSEGIERKKDFLSYFAVNLVSLFFLLKNAFLLICFSSSSSSSSFSLFLSLSSHKVSFDVFLLHGLVFSLLSRQNAFFSVFIQHSSSFFFQHSSSPFLIHASLHTFFSA